MPIMSSGTTQIGRKQLSENRPSPKDIPISIQDLSVSFGGGPAVLDHVNLDIPPGSFVSIVGASGCGKTTLMNVVAGLVPYSEGTVLIGDSAPRAGRRDIAYILARDALLPWRTVRMNIEYALKLNDVPSSERREIAMDYLDRVGLAHAEGLYPSKLSQGMRQRVSLARAFAVNRSVYLLDEPFSALDAQTKLLLHEQLLALWEEDKKTVVFVTHDIGEAVALSDRVVVMGTGGRGVIDQIDVKLERPRVVAEMQEDEKYHAIYRQAWGSLRRGMS